MEEMALRCSLVCAASTLGVGLGVGLRLRGGGRVRCSLVCAASTLASRERSIAVARAPRVRGEGLGVRGEG